MHMLDNVFFDAGDGIVTINTHVEFSNSDRRVAGATRRTRLLRARARRDCDCAEVQQLLTGALQDRHVRLQRIRAAALREAVTTCRPAEYHARIASLSGGGQQSRYRSHMRHADTDEVTTDGRTMADWVLDRFLPPTTHRGQPISQRVRAQAQAYMRDNAWLLDAAMPIPAGTDAEAGLADPSCN